MASLTSWEVKTQVSSLKHPTLSLSSLGFVIYRKEIEVTNDVRIGSLVFQIILSQKPNFFDLLSILHGNTVTKKGHFLLGVAVTERKSVLKVGTEAKVPQSLSELT